MSFLARLFGLQQEPKRPAYEPLYGNQPLYGQTRPGSQPSAAADAQAIERYRYMLRSAPPEAIEQAHEEAFSKLSPEQRMLVLRELNGVVPDHERVAEASGAAEPRTLARMATRAELRQPGMIERTLGGMGGGMGAGGMIAGTIFGALVAGFVGSMIAEQFMEGFGEEIPEEMAVEEPVAEGEDVGGFGDFGGFEEF